MKIAQPSLVNAAGSSRGRACRQLATIRTLASHAYHPPSSPNAHASSSRTQPQPPAATTSTPSDLTPQQRLLLERTIRVDQAGELGANWIYKGQKLVMDVLGEKKTAQKVEVRLAA
jgi:ubiquinone biosynthesis monooxygenase Coq7